MTVKQPDGAWNDNYNLKLVSDGLRRPETINHYADAFQHLENISEDVFKRFSSFLYLCTKQKKSFVFFNV